MAQTTPYADSCHRVDPYLRMSICEPDGRFASTGVPLLPRMIVTHVTWGHSDRLRH
jgi:hypothetical protein